MNALIPTDKIKFENSWDLIFFPILFSIYSIWDLMNREISFGIHLQTDLFCSWVINFFSLWEFFLNENIFINSYSYVSWIKILYLFNVLRILWEINILKIWILFPFEIKMNKLRFHEKFHLFSQIFFNTHKYQKNIFSSYYGPIDLIDPNGQIQTF